jgi:hypothetical protein
MSTEKNVIAPEWLVKRIKASRAEMQKQLDVLQSFSGHDPNPNKTMETKLRIGNYDEILDWMKKAELDVFSVSLQNKYG